MRLSKVNPYVCIITSFCLRADWKGFMFTAFSRRTYQECLNSPHMFIITVKLYLNQHMLLTELLLANTVRKKQVRG